MYRKAAVCCLGLLLLAPWWAGAEEPFKKLVDSGVNTPDWQPPYQVGYLTWGGDVAGFVANGGALKTQKGSIYDRLGAEFTFVNGDNLPDQVKRYLKGETPFIRGEVGMLGIASEVLGQMKPRILLQITYSKGDHVIAREGVKTLDDLKKLGRKPRWTAQQHGPHVTLIDTVLRNAGLTWKDIDMVWVPEIIGPKGPKAKFVEDPTIDLACVITAPDGMLALTGGLESQGSGAEGTVKGAHVLVSTANYDRVIADVLGVREDFYQAHRDVCEKLVAGYLAGEQRIVTLKKAGGPEYKRDVLQVAQNIFTKELLPELDTDAAGLIDDAIFVGLPGQIAFFRDAGNLQGFAGKQKGALDLATGQGYAVTRSGFEVPDWDYKRIAEMAGIPYAEPKRERTVTAESPDVSSYIGGEIDAKTIVTFMIHFDANQRAFNRDTYGADFQRVLEQLAQGNVVMVVEGHSDVNEVLLALLKAGKEKGLITEQGTAGSKQYFLDGKPFDFRISDRLRQMIDEGQFDGAQENPKRVMTAALNLSQSRAEAVRDAIVQYAKEQRINVTPAQIQAVGLGVARPAVPVPHSAADKQRNRQVVFRLIKQKAESDSDDEFIGK